MSVKQLPQNIESAKVYWLADNGGDTTAEPRYNMKQFEDAIEANTFAVELTKKGHDVRIYLAVETLRVELNGVQ